MNNQIAKQKPSFRTAITTDKFQRAINNTLQDPNRARRFTSSIISAVSRQSCTTRVRSRNDSVGGIAR